MTVQDKHYPLIGGTDMVTPAIRTTPGRARASENYEPVEEGFRRIDGFERFDGRPKPSEATYHILDFDQGTAAINEGDTVTGATSGATAEALIDAVVETGSYGGSDATGYLVLLNVTGTFQDDENLQVSAATKCVADGVTSEKGADTDALDTTYLRDAIETTRADILTVTGSGNMRGVVTLAGVTYAFRDNAGGTAVAMYKSTASGWSLQDLGETLSFTSGGTHEILEEDTITGATSGATATVKRVIVDSGSWAGGDAAGRLIVYSVSGTFQAENLDEGANLNVATISGDAAPNTLPAGGKYVFHKANIVGHSGTDRIYGANGVGTAFEWDGSVFVPIVTGMTTDTPTRVRVHQKHLVLTFPGGSVQISGLGAPYSWTIVTGASELVLGEEITDLAQDTTEALTPSLVIYGRNKIAKLYGTSEADWQLVDLSEDAGAIAYSAQSLQYPVYMDDQGLRSLRTTQKVGDFQMGTLSNDVKPLFRSKKKAGVTVTWSMRVRSKDQYRIFFSDGTAIFMYMGRKNPELMHIDLGKVVHCGYVGEDTNGNEILFFGSTDGYVYQMDAGTSFDGSQITAFLRLPFNHIGKPQRSKQWRKAIIETDAATDSAIGVIADFGYADPDRPIADEQTFNVRGGGGFWNEDNWNEFYWSSQAVGLAEAHIDGEGATVSLVLRSEATYEEPHTFHGITLLYSELRLLK